MADISKLRGGRRRLGEPPVDDAPQIQEPAPQREVVPPLPGPAVVAPVSEPAQQVRTRTLPRAVDTYTRVDGRSLRRTGRAVQFATRVTPAYDQGVREVAAERGQMLCEVMEDALAAWRKLLEASRAEGVTPEALLDAMLERRQTITSQ